MGLIKVAQDRGQHLATVTGPTNQTQCSIRGIKFNDCAERLNSKLLQRLLFQFCFTVTVVNFCTQLFDLQTSFNVISIKN